MSIHTTVPITIRPDAAARVDELGMRRELDLMLDYLRQNTPGLHAITVELDAEANPEDNASIIIETQQDDPGPAADHADGKWWDWADWVVQTFPPDVFRHFARMPCFEAPHGR